MTVVRMCIALSNGTHYPLTHKKVSIICIALIKEFKISIIFSHAWMIVMFSHKVN